MDLLVERYKKRKCLDCVEEFSGYFTDGKKYCNACKMKRHLGKKELIECIICGEIVEASTKVSIACNKKECRKKSYELSRKKRKELR